MKMFLEVEICLVKSFLFLVMDEMKGEAEERCKDSDYRRNTLIDHTGRTKTPNGKLEGLTKLTFKKR